jgi:hypothetical protein
MLAIALSLIAAYAMPFLFFAAVINRGWVSAIAAFLSVGTFSAVVFATARLLWASNYTGAAAWRGRAP